MVKMLLTRHHLQCAFSGRGGQQTSQSGYLAPELSKPTPGQLLR